MVRRSLVWITVLAVSACAHAGLVDWAASERAPTAKAALQLVRTKPGWLHARWRAVGSEKWEGGLTGWDERADGLIAGGTGDGLFTAVLKASDWHGAVRLTLTLTATRAVDQPTEVVANGVFAPGGWQRQFYPRLPYLQLPPEAKATVRFLADRDDATAVPDSPHVVFYPFGVLESDAGFVIWGAPDVGMYAVLTPNAVETSIPCLSLRPKKLAAGQELTFDLFLKRFPKPEFRYRDVLGWYLRSTENSDPLTQGLLPWDGRCRARRLPVGNLAGGCGRLGRSEVESAAVLPDLKARHVASLWFQGWGPWDETYPTEGGWWNEWGSRVGAEQVKAEVAWERASGLFPLMYCRQFLAEQGVHADRPPLAEWLGRDENGNRQAWGDAKLSGEMAKELGFDALQQSCADFGNDRFREWYEGRIKACLDSYRPAGIAWDMGWAAPAGWEYSRGNPRTSNSHGMFRAQADLWRWLPQHQPEVRVIANEAPGTPSQLVADGVLIESGFAGGKTDLDYEAAKAIGTTVISYEYPDNYAQQLRGLPTATLRYLQIRYRAVGIDTTTGRYVVWPSQGIPGKEGPALTCSQLQVDGQWHVATFDLRNLPAIERVKDLAVGLQAGADEGRLWIDTLRFSKTPDGPPALNEEGSFPAEITAKSLQRFEARPGWMGNPAAEYGVREDGGALEFWVKGAGKAMSWQFFPAQERLAQEFMHVLSLGACVGGGLRPEWTLLNSFSAEAMSLPPLVGSHDVEVLPATSRVTASAWGGAGKLLVAAHNGGTGAEEVQVVVRAGAAIPPGKSITSVVLGKDALPARPGPEGDRSAQGSLRLRVRLEPGEALLWGTWKGEWEYRS